MEHIWAPWRLAYVTGGDKRPDDACFLCAARAGSDDAATLVIARSKRCFAILNRYPYNPGHLMIAPNDHVPGIEDLSATTLSAMMSLAQARWRVAGSMTLPRAGTSPRYSMAASA
ncbi:MAG TPA: HIT domain-containing protein [Ktedonobacterales bacterium]|nr:HIT domain-containing protein [Ktedonobacterales bacterium]